jgi:hypothetical protein
MGVSLYPFASSNRVAPLFREVEVIPPRKVPKISVYGSLRVKVYCRVNAGAQEPVIICLKVELVYSVFTRLVVDLHHQPNTGRHQTLNVVFTGV